MEAVVLNIMWALECLMIIVCLHIAFTQKFRFNIRLLGIVLCNNGLFALQHYGYIPKVFAYSIFAILFMYFYHLSNKKIVSALLRFVFGIILAGVIEIGVTLTLLFCGNAKDASAEQMLMGSMASFTISCVIYVLLIKLEKNSKLEVKDKKEIIVLLVICSSAIILLLDYWVAHLMNALQNFVVWILCGLVYLYVVVIQKKNQEAEIKDLELSMHRMYGEAYKELQGEVRKIQHNYKNELATLKSMPLVAKNLDELIAMQEDYGSETEKDAKYEKIMTSCENTILAGYLYYKCRDMETSGIRVEAKIRIQDGECGMRIHELIEVLGILLDNAAEYLLEREGVMKNVTLELLEYPEYILIRVENPSEIYPSEEIGRFFQKGYSTKGRNRGIGLFRVKELAEKTKAELQVFNGEREGTGRMEISLRIEK